METTRLSDYDCFLRHRYIFLYTKEPAQDRTPATTRQQEKRMSLIEYKGYKISISAQEETWGFAFGEWRGTYRIWQQDNSEPIQGIIKDNAPSAYEAEKRALQFIQSAIDDALQHCASHLRRTLR